MTSLEKSVLATLVYYDVLDRPLTGWEVFILRSLAPKSYLGAKLLSDVLNVLNNSPELAKLISQKNGFYFLKGRQRIIKQRIEKQKIADKKWKKTRSIIRFFQTIPFVRLVMVSGSLAMNNVRQKSDIDLLIVSKTGRIWTCRAFITLFCHLIKKRRHRNLTKDRLCLNHYLTENSLKVPYQSLYNAQTYAHLTPIWQNKKKLYNKFQKANKWIGNYLINYQISQRGYLREINPNRFLNDLRELRELLLDGIIGNFIEFILKKFQQTRIRKDPLTYQPGGRIIFSDKQLEFHPNSPERKIIDKYNKKMRMLGIEEMGNEKDSGLTI